MNHFDEMTCLLYLEGELAAARAMELETHAKECAACGAMLRALRAESLLLTTSLREADEALPARLAVRQESGAARWAWLLGFSLAGAGGVHGVDGIDCAVAGKREPIGHGSGESADDAIFQRRSLERVEFDD